MLAAETKEQKRARMDEAVELVAQAKSGKDFAALVEAESGAVEGAGRTDRSGGPFRSGRARRRGNHQDPAGEVVGPIPTGRLADLRIEQKLDEKLTPFDAARMRCEEAVRQQKFPVIYEKFMTGLWDAATIEVRKDYEARLPRNMKEKVTYR